MARTPHEMIELLHAALPERLSSSTLQEYDLELSPADIERATQEILSLSFFWMDQAIRALLPQDLTDLLVTGIRQSVRDRWETPRFVLNPDYITGFFERVDQQHLVWSGITQQGGEPIAVMSEAVSSLDLEGSLSSPDRQNLLALFLDLVPVDQFGEIAGGMDADLANTSFSA